MPQQAAEEGFKWDNLLLVALVHSFIILRVKRLRNALARLVAHEWYEYYCAEDKNTAYFALSLIKGESVMRLFGRTLRISPAWIAVLLSLGIALLIYGPHLFDGFVPVEGDARAHIFKIDLLQTFLSNADWPQWNPYWYNGIPFDPFYPPGFYMLGAALTFIFQHAVISYKVLLLVSLASNGLVICYFARRFLKMEWLPAILCLVAYETSTALLVNYLYGEGPDLLGWSVSMVFLTIYLCRIKEGKIGHLRSAILPGLLLGIAILIHPFPVIFVGAAVLLFHIVWYMHNRKTGINIGEQIRFFVIVFGIAVILSAYYWLPALLTIKYASPIYVFTADAWLGSMPYLLLMTVLPLVTALIIRPKIQSKVTFDFIITCLIMASLMGFGASRLLPFGLGSLIHEFRFATIMAPFFSILLLAYLLKDVPLAASKNKMIEVFLLSSLMIVLILLAFLRSGMRLANLVAFLGIALIPTFILMLLAFNLRNGGDINVKQTKITTGFLAGLCLFSLLSIVPASSTWSKANFGRLFSYVNTYETPEYSEILQQAADSRLLVPIARGYLSEGDSFVTFGWRWGVESLNGPYNQGDPKFFKYTVHVEWEERWFNYKQTRLNLLQEGGAGYIFIRDSQLLLVNANDLNLVEENSFGSLLKLDQQVAAANFVTPVLLDVKSPQKATEFFNILVPNGYKLVFVESAGLDNEIKDQFSYVLTDDAAKAKAYQGKTVFLLNDSSVEIGVKEDSGFVIVSAPVTEVADMLFYHGDEGDIKAWGTFESLLSPRMMYNGLTSADTIGEALAPYLTQLLYEPVSYQYFENEIEVLGQAGFTLVKNSYFPYWSAEQGTVIGTTQGFMLLYSDNADLQINYSEPVTTSIAATISIGSLISVFIVLFMVNKKNK